MNLSIETLSATEHRRILRFRLGLTQTEIAKQLGVSRVFYRLWEYGQKTSKPLQKRFDQFTAQRIKQLETKQEPIL